MPIHIGEYHTTVHAADSDALLSPEVRRQIVNDVLAILREERAYEARRDEERRLRSAVAPAGGAGTLGDYLWEGRT